MVLGRIIGKSTTTRFDFEVKGSAKKMQFIQVYHPEHDFVLCQIIELQRDVNQTIANCHIIGFRDPQGRIRGIRTPFESNAEVLEATDDLIRQVIQLDDSSKGAMVGRLDGRSINIFLNINKMLTRHIAVLAKSGSGKSYTVGVLLEELLSHNIPIIIIDPHGEYAHLKWPNDKQEDIERLAPYSLQPKGFAEQIREYGDIRISPDIRPITLANKLSPEEILHILPTKLSQGQQALFYSSIKDYSKLTFEELGWVLSQQDNPSKHALLSIINYMRGLNLFSGESTNTQELIQPGKASVVSLKGLEPQVQEIVVYKLLKDLFEARKLEKIPPFFAVVEEAHNFAPERGFGETKSSKVIRTIAAEGRKFGMGLCVITQRPARIEKNVLSQCSTQIILKVTNPGDIKAITSSVEGINSESENEIRNLPIGVAMVTGVVDIPLFVSIRPRMTKHGGTTVNIINDEEEDDIDAQEQIQDYSEKKIIPLVKPNITETDLLIMSDDDTAQIKKVLVPGYALTCKDKEESYKVLFDAHEGSIVVDLENYNTKLLPDFQGLTPQELTLLETLFRKGRIDQADYTHMVNQGKDEDFKRLESKGLIKVDQGVTLNNKYLFSKLIKHQSYAKVEFEEMKSSTMLERHFDEEQVKNMLSKFTGVQDSQECFVLKYETVRTQ